MGITTITLFMRGVVAFRTSCSWLTGTVFVVDRAAVSLYRIWCALELRFTQTEGKPIELYTPSGMVGSKHVSSGPLVEAIKSFDDAVRGITRSTTPPDLELHG